MNEGKKRNVQHSPSVHLADVQFFADAPDMSIRLEMLHAVNEPQLDAVKDKGAKRNIVNSNGTGRKYIVYVMRPLTTDKMRKRRGKTEKSQKKRI